MYENSKVVCVDQQALSKQLSPETSLVKSSKCRNKPEKNPMVETAFFQNLSPALSSFYFEHLLLPIHCIVPHFFYVTIIIRLTIY